MEGRLLLPTGEVAAGGVVEGWVGSAIGLEGAVVAHRDAPGERLLERVEQGIGEDQLRIAVLVHVAEPEGGVAHLGEHAAFVGGIDVAVVVVDEYSASGPGGG